MEQHIWQKILSTRNLEALIVAQNILLACTQNLWISSWNNSQHNTHIHYWRFRSDSLAFERKIFLWSSLTATIQVFPKCQPNRHPLLKNFYQIPWCTKISMNMHKELQNKKKPVLNSINPISNPGRNVFRLKKKKIQCHFMRHIKVIQKLQILIRYKLVVLESK